MRGAVKSKRRLAVLAAGFALLVAGPGALPALGESLCGNGVEEGNEYCDDGNTIECDGCNASCTQDECGDGVLTTCGEECDDANTVSGDGCAPDCACEPDVCGDGIQGCLETCDDGNTVDCDGCTKSCEIELCAPQTKDQQACVNAVNKGLAGVVKAQSSDNASCTRSVTTGRIAAPGDCLGADLDQKVSRAQQKTAEADAAKCGGPGSPTFSYNLPAIVNGAGSAEPLEAMDVVFGDAPAIVLKAADPQGAKCQAEVLKQLAVVMNRWASEANKAKKRALKGGKGNPPSPAPAQSASEVSAGIDTALAASVSLGKAEARAIAGITDKCTDAQASDLFDCGDATSVAELAACVVTAAEEAACSALEVADGLDLACPTLPVLSLAEEHGAPL